MSSVTRCDVCKTISDAWMPEGWQTVTPIGFIGANLLTTHVCQECWDFLLHERGEE